MRILLVEDEPVLSETLAAILSHQHYTVDAVFDGTQALQKALTGIYDVLILDINLPGLDGLSVLRQLRAAQQEVPVLLLSAKGEVADIIQGLDAGANDYLAKPFNIEELLARLRAMTRSHLNRSATVLTFADLALDLQTGRLFCGVKQIHLAAKEFQLMELFIRNHGQILTKEKLTQKVWGFDSQAEYNNVEVYISFLRKKLQAIGSQTHIYARRGLGYVLEAPNAAAPPYSST